MKDVSGPCATVLPITCVQNVAGVCERDKLYICGMTLSTCLRWCKSCPFAWDFPIAFVFLLRCIGKIVFIKLDNI
jgi:hypothetical protein